MKDIDLQGHRGTRGWRPENTLPAFEHALAIGVTTLELDIGMTRDGVVVVHHDRLLGRTSRGVGAVRDRTAEELATFDVPTLRAVLERYPHAKIIVELKEASDGLARAAIEEVRRARAAARVWFGSFSTRALRAVRRIDPGMATSAGRMEVRLALYRSWVGLSPSRAPYRALQVPETSGVTRVVSPRFVRLAHKAGVVVQVWTVDDPDDIRRLLEWGVDGIITDRPDVAVAIAREWMSTRSPGVDRP